MNLRDEFIAAEQSDGNNPPWPENVRRYGGDWKPFSENKAHKPSPEILLNAPRGTVKSVLRFRSEHFLRPRRISLLVAPIGTGKTTVSEAILSSHLNPYADTFGLRVEPDPEGRPLLLIDFERTQDEILEGCDRIKRRIAIEENPELVTNEERFKDTFIHGFLQYSRTEDKKKELASLIDKYNPYLVILDGAASLVYDINKTEECVETVGELLAIADEKNLSFFATVHPNPGQQNDYKPRGVFGSELLRYAESVLLLKRAPDDRDTRILTTSFMHGKNRSGADNLETYFRWSDTHKMFMSCDYAMKPKQGRAKLKEETVSEILSGKRMPYSDLKKLIIQKDKSGPTAERWIKDLQEAGFIVKNPNDGHYSMSDEPPF